METVINVKPLDNYQILVCFSDNYTAKIDIKPYIGKGISNELSNPDFFKKVKVDEFGGITWENGFDFCPVYLREICMETVNLVK